MTEHDPVNHPSHYTSHPSGVECIEVIRHMPFNLGNVVKYLWRAGIKDGAPTLQDLKKARWYLDDEITQLERAEVLQSHDVYFSVLDYIDRKAAAAGVSVDVTGAAEGDIDLTLPSLVRAHKTNTGHTPTLTDGTWSCPLCGWKYVDGAVTNDPRIYCAQCTQLITSGLKNPSERCHHQRAHA